MTETERLRAALERIADDQGYDHARSGPENVERLSEMARAALASPKGDGLTRPGTQADWARAKATPGFIEEQREALASPKGDGLDGGLRAAVVTLLEVFDMKPRPRLGEYDQQALDDLRAALASPKGDGLDPDWLFVLKATHPIGGVFTDMPASNVERVCEVARRRTRHGMSDIDARLLGLAHDLGYMDPDDLQPILARWGLRLTLADAPDDTLRAALDAAAKKMTEAMG